jgi:hypothetical protein
MPKVTLEQKRLEALRRQLQGRGEVRVKQSKSHADSKSIETSWLHTQNLHSTDLKEITAKHALAESGSSFFQVGSAYLKRDLLKILILSALAMSLQLLLYFSVRNNLLNLRFF